MADLFTDQWGRTWQNINGWPVQSRAVELTSRVVTRQQLDSPDFFQLVKGPPLLMGEVDVIDQRSDRVVVNGEALTFDDPRAAVALAGSQERWAGVNQQQQAIYDTLGVDWLTRQLQDVAQGNPSPAQVAQQTRNVTGDLPGLS